MPTRRSSRASDARVRSALRLVRDACEGRHGRQRKATLTPAEYKRLLESMEQPENEDIQGEFKDIKHGYNYTRSQNCFEIRVPPLIQERVISEVQEKIGEWYHELGKGVSTGRDQRIIDAANNIWCSGKRTIDYPFPKGILDAVSPNVSFWYHQCRECMFPTFLIEAGWVWDPAKLAEMAKLHIRQSKGHVRTVVTLDMYKIYLAEKMNAARGYENNEKNENIIATFSIWRATVDGDPIRAIVEKVFRDSEGKPVSSVALKLSFKDFVCQGILDSAKGALEDQSLAISSDESFVKQSI